jgi:hypothetical protein
MYRRYAWSSANLGSMHIEGGGQESFPLNASVGFSFEILRVGR